MRTLTRVESEVHRAGFGFAREPLAEIVAALVRESVAVVEIDRAAALRSRIYAKLQRPAGSFVGVLNQRLERQDASAVHINRHRIQLRMNLARLGEFNVGTTLRGLCDRWRGRLVRSFLSRPEVVPGTGRE